MGGVAQTKQPKSHIIASYNRRMQLAKPLLGEWDNLQDIQHGLDASAFGSHHPPPRHRRMANSRPPSLRILIVVTEKSE